MYACLAVTCHLHFWQNDRDFLRATLVTRGWNEYWNKSQHRKSTLEKKILPPFQQGFEPVTFQSRVRCSNHWAIPARGSLGYPLAVLSLGRSRQVSQKLRLSTGGNPWKIITGSDWQPGTLKTPSEYCRRAFYALSRHFPSTFWIPKKNENSRAVHDVLRRCTFIHLYTLFAYVNCTISVPSVPFVDSSST